MFKKVHFESKREIPLGVKIISIIHYIFTGMYLLFGIVMIFGANSMTSSLIGTYPEIEEALTPGLIIGIGFFFIALAVFALLVGIGLWRLKKWAKIVTIIFTIIWLINLIYSIITAFAFIQIFWTIICIYIGVYLLFSKKSKLYFK